MKSRIYYKYLPIIKRKNKLDKKTAISFLESLCFVEIKSIRINPDKKIYLSGKGKIGKADFNVKLKKTS